MHTIGSRRQVWNGTAKKTSGGLLKSDLMMNKNGRIVSKSKHNTAKKENRLVKAGYGTKKGVFGSVKIGSKKHRKGSKKQRGGHVNINVGNGIDGAGITPGGPNTMALMAGGKRRKARKMSGGMTSYNQMARYAELQGLNVPTGPGGVVNAALNAAS